MSRILPPSDLIVNSDQRIYHLDLQPGELADTIILVGDPARVTKVSQHFDEIQVRRQHREIITHTGLYKGKRLSVISTGMGPDNIDIVMNELDALKNIDFVSAQEKSTLSSLTIIRIGTCGGLQGDLPLHAYIVGSHGLGLDNLMHYYQHTHQPDEQAILSALAEHLKKTPISPYLCSANTNLVKHFQPEAYAGITATCGGFYGPQGRYLRAAPKYLDLLTTLSEFSYEHLKCLNFEMETSAIYGLGQLLGHRCCSLNLMVANRINKQFSKDYSQAMEGFIEWALERILSLD